MGASPGVPRRGSCCEHTRAGLSVGCSCSSGGLGLQGWGERHMLGVAGLEGGAVSVVWLGLPAGERDASVCF